MSTQPRLQLDLGDGRAVGMDMPPPEIFLALARIEAARKGGVPANDPALDGDMQLLLAWMDEQEERYPTPAPPKQPPKKAKKKR